MPKGHFPRKKKELPEEQADFIKSASSSLLTLTIAEFAERFNQRFKASISSKTMKRWCRKILGTFSGQANKLSSDQIRFFKDNAELALPSREIADMFNLRFGTSITVAQALYYRKKFNLAGNFSRAAAASLRCRPPGTERRRKNSHMEVKTGITRNGGWELKHKAIWEAHYGPCPAGYWIVFVDGDSNNFDLGNLLAVPNSLYSFIRTKKLPASVLSSPALIKNIILLRNISRRTAALNKNRRGKKALALQPPELYEFTGRPGFAL